jgi:hypothetical protein
MHLLKIVGGVYFWRLGKLSHLLNRGVGSKVEKRLPRSDNDLAARSFKVLNFGS